MARLSAILLLLVAVQVAQGETFTQLPWPSPPCLSPACPCKLLGGPICALQSPQGLFTRSDLRQTA